MAPRIRKAARSPVGGLKGQATIASGTLRSKHGTAAQQILVTTAEGKKRAYVLAVFTTPQTSRSVLEAQALVNTLRFTK